MKLQVSVDLVSLDQAMNLLKEVAPYVDVMGAQQNSMICTTLKHLLPE